MRWCCGISHNLETLILDHPVSYLNLATLLQSCPNLKNLQMGRNSAHRDSSYSMKIFHSKTTFLTTLSVSVVGGLLPQEVHLPKLEIYLFSDIDFNRFTPKLKRDILCNVNSLRVLRASIEDEDVEDIQFVRPMTDVFQNLTALDLTKFSYNVLQILATIPNLQLKYLGLGKFPQGLNSSVQEYETNTARYREAFHQLLPRLKELEVLTTWFVPGITNETIQLLTDLESNLKFAVLAHSFVRVERTHNGSLRTMPADPLDLSLLTKFRDRLLLRNPRLDLSDFHFIVEEPELRDQLVTSDVGFTITYLRNYLSEYYALSGLCCPTMRNRLSINF